jgi:hypothetical protein
MLVLWVVMLCGLIATSQRLKVRGFKPGRGDGFLRAIKMRSTPLRRGSEAIGPMLQGYTAC